MVLVLCERMIVGGLVTEVQAQLGHSSLAVTTVYLAHLDAGHLAAGLAQV